MTATALMTDPCVRRGAGIRAVCIVTALTASVHHAAGQEGGPVADAAATGAGLERGPAEAAWNPTPVDITGPDRADIDEELEAAMDMTPPGRQVRIELGSGSTLLLSVSSYEPGPGGADCRAFDYEYRTFNDGHARVTGLRCWLPETGWRPGRMDTLVESDGLPSVDRTPIFEPAAPISMTDGDRNAQSQIAPDDTSAAPKARLVETPGNSVPMPAANAPPPSRIILPFVLDDARPASPR